MPNITTKRHPVRLTYEDGQVVVTPSDHDIFFISAERATEACREAILARDRVRKFKEEVIAPIMEWCQKNKEKVSACYLVSSNSAVLPVYVVGTSEVYDFDLTEKMSEFAAWFEERKWSVHLSQITMCDQEAIFGFFHEDNALQIQCL